MIKFNMAQEQDIKTILKGKTKGYLNLKNGLYVFFGDGTYFKLRDKYETDKNVLITAEILAQ